MAVSIEELINKKDDIQKNKKRVDSSTFGSQTHEWKTYRSLIPHLTPILLHHGKKSIQKRISWLYHPSWLR